jgi:hypothetical protein
VNEAGHKRKLVAEVNALRGGWARRVEDRWAVGVLDLIIKLPERPILFAEGKLIEGNVFGPTERQWVEGARLLAANLAVALIGWRGNQMSISPWYKQADRRECLTGTDYVQTLDLYLRNAPRNSDRHAG